MGNTCLRGFTGKKQNLQNMGEKSEKNLRQDKNQGREAIQNIFFNSNQMESKKMSLADGHNIIAALLMARKSKLQQLVQENKKHKPHLKLDEIREKVIGLNTRYISPFKIELQSVYVDHTATNRPYRDVELMIEYAKRFQANPHTLFSHYGKFSTYMMHYAHDSLLNTFSASHDDFVALPTNSGSTGAIQKCIRMFLNVEKEKSERDVFITPYQHHSNILPWVEYFKNVTAFASDQKGILNLQEIKKQLTTCKNNRIIVSISAASNVTSQLTDLHSMNQIIKHLRFEKNIIFGVDCAAFCCHHQLNLSELNQIDFVYLSPHKNLGGVQSCGVLIARKSMVNASKPTFPGGGTVAFVKGYKKQDVLYDADVFSKQIAGTPPFLGFYRAALSFELLKKDIGYDFIHENEKKNTKIFFDRINQQNQKFKNQNKQIQIFIYGEQNLDKRANVVTFNIYRNGGIPVNYNFVSLILADVFGIQLRSGCFCAGPFGMKLLQLSQQKANQLQEKVRLGILKVKPGYLRLDLTFYLKSFEVQFIANAIIQTAKYIDNMEQLYTVCNDGQIQRHKLFTDDSFFVGYQLTNSFFAEQVINTDKQKNSQRLKNRQSYLQKQFKNGVQILQNPMHFLRQQMTKINKRTSDWQSSGKAFKSFNESQIKK